MKKLRIRAKHTAPIFLLLIACGLTPNRADAQDDESLARFCVATASGFLMTNQDSIPEFAGYSPAPVPLQPYWRQLFRGATVPIPKDTDGWSFSISEFSYGSDLVVLSHQRLNISYALIGSTTAISVDALKKITAEVDLPSPTLGQIALIRNAVEIVPEQVMCNPNDIEATVNAMSAVFLKSSVLQTYDKAYPSPRGSTWILTDQKWRTMGVPL